MSEVAIVAALEREIAGLVGNWRRVRKESVGGRFEFFENGDAVLVCGGIGAQAARRAAEVVVALYQPSVLVSVGFAGALDDSLRVGSIVEPATVVDARDSGRIPAESGSGVVVSFVAVADEEQKVRLASAYGALAVDMEAASVGRVAQIHGLRFRAVKAISDELGFPMPPMDRFVASDGSFRSGRFALDAAIRPWKWLAVMRLARNSAAASRALCDRLGGLLAARRNDSPSAATAENVGREG